MPQWGKLCLIFGENNAIHSFYFSVTSSIAQEEERTEQHPLQGEGRQSNVVVRNPPFGWCYCLPSHCGSCFFFLLFLGGGAGPHRPFGWCYLIYSFWRCCLPLLLGGVAFTTSRVELPFSFVFVYFLPVLSIITVVFATNNHHDTTALWQKGRTQHHPHVF